MKYIGNNCLFVGVRDPIMSVFLSKGLQPRWPTAVQFMIRFTCFEWEYKMRHKQFFLTTQPFKNLIYSPVAG